MPEVGSTWVTVLPDMRRFNTDLSRQATASGDTAGKTFGSGFAKAATVGLAVFGAARIFGGFIADAQESARVSRLTENAILATGGAANVTAKQVSDLSTSLSNKTAIDDELIQSGANLILTFKNIRNEAGAGNDIFDQTTEAALNLSAAGFGSVESASIMLGKALNDPLTGLTSLGRAGVTFTEQQKEQIRVLTESGDVLGAQRIILDEVASQVGGAAEAAADPIEKLKVTMANLGETVGTWLLPVVEGFANFLGEDLIPAIKSTVEFVDRNKVAIIAVTGAMAALFAITKIHTAYLAVQAVGGLVAYIAQMGVVQALTKTWTAVQWLLNIALSANPIGLVVAAIALLVGAVIYAWQNFEWFRNVVVAVWEGIQTAAQWAWDNVLNPVFGFIGAAVGAVGGAFTWLWHSIVEPVWNGIQTAISTVWYWLKDNVFTPFEAIFGTIGNAFETFGGTVSRIWSDIQQIFVEAVNGVIGFINGFLDAINWVGEQVGLDFGLHIGYIPIPGLGPGIAGPSGGSGTAFATGGKVPGQGDGDTVPAWLTPGEIVIRKDIAKPFEDFLLALNSGQAEAIQAAGGRGGRGPQRFATGGTVASAQEWARANAGRPYIWGGVGPDGWDCSGWMSDIANHLLGTTMGVRRFATASMSGGVNAGGFVRGLDNEFTIGVDPGSHTAGTLGGINVESGSGHGGIIGGIALGTNSGFSYQYYLPGSYGFNAGMEARSAQQKYAIPPSGFQMTDIFMGVGNWMMDQIAGSAEEKNAGWADANVGTYDRGGILRSGDMAVNRSGHDELVLDPSQTAALLGGGGPVRIEGSVRLSADGTLLEFVNAVITRSDGAKTVRRRAEQRTAR